MALLKLDGVDITDSAADVVIEKVMNERAKATFAVEGVIPEEDQVVLAYAKDGTTLIFGGLVLDWDINGPSDNDTEHDIAEVEAVGWERYTDWCSISLSYDVPVDVEDVLDDIVTDVLGDYGITYTPTATGIQLAPFSCTNMPVADLIRQLRERTGLVITFNPDKSITTSAPGATAAPFQITDANLYRLSKFKVGNQSRERGNRVVITFGPTGHGDDIEHTWTADGVATEFSLLDQNVRASDVWPGVVTIDGTSYPIWPAGGAPGGEGIEWANAVADGTLSFLGAPWVALIPNGAEIVLRYAPQFPFTIARETGATPVKEVRLTKENTIDYGAAVEITDQALARIDRASAKRLDIITDEDGFDIGQALTVNTTARGGVVAAFLIAAITIAMVIGDEHWEYSFQVTEGDQPQPTSNDDWRQLTGGRGSSTELSVVSGGGSSSSSGSGTAIRFPLGGSRSNSQAMGTTRTPVLDWQPFEAPADMTATVRVTCLTINAGQTVTPYLTKYNSGTMAWDIVATGTGTTSTTGAEQTFSAALTSGAFYRLEHVTNNSAGEACTIGQLQGVA